MNFQIRRPDETLETAFTFTELLAVLCTFTLLGFIVLPVLARDSDSPERAVCLNNMKRIMAAVSMYSTDNNELLPHPSWGSDLTGPDSGCYAVRLPTGQRPISAAGKAGPEAHTNQIPFYLAGQLARYLESQRVLVCPSDWRESMSSKRLLYTGRTEKLTCYTMNGTVGGYVGRPGLIASGSTFKATSFFAPDLLLWEKNEMDPFNFNDAASNPENLNEGISRRHEASNGEGLGGVGRAGGTADFVKWGTFSNFIRVPRPNDLLCGPGYQ
jgi:competence protein ComGC